MQKSFFKCALCITALAVPFTIAAIAIVFVIGGLSALIPTIVIDDRLTSELLTRAPEVIGMLVGLVMLWAILPISRRQRRSDGEGTPV